MNKSIEHKTAQKFVILAYLRYKAARKLRNNAFNKNFEMKYEWAAAENEAWNHLQSAKEIYYELL